MTEARDKSILVVDDSIAIRNVVRAFLQLSGYQTLEAENGLVALNVVLSHEVDLVISDIKMPRMDGYTLLKELKKNPDTQCIPIVMLTTEEEPTQGEPEVDAAEAWVRKPFQATTLLSAVERLI